ncbi:hypothetical protein C8J57DRAFT_1609195 [Mycena rebaudengoi]|nr:hypothetical protein C8J57DRAFT_1609195 [Mycena rebaudengoi]
MMSANLALLFESLMDISAASNTPVLRPGQVLCKCSRFSGHREPRAYSLCDSKPTVCLRQFFFRIFTDSDSFIKTVATTSDSVPTPPSSDTATTPLPIHTEDDAIQAPVMVATAAAAGLTAPAAVAAPKNDKKATPGKSSTPRNLCMIKWCIDNPGGMNSKFKLHWDTIHKTPAAEEWIAVSAAAAAAKTKAAL